MKTRLTVRILVVEDEDAVAADIQRRLKSFGYASAAASTDSEALSIAREMKPDLVLMDIKLKGATDGIMLAQKLRDSFGIPAVYLTAYSDAPTVSRAKLTNPLGYLLKPFTDSELHAAIEIALHKQAADSKVRESEAWYRAILQSTSDAVIVTDIRGSIRFLNLTAEKLTGWRSSEAVGKKLETVFRITSENRRAHVDIPFPKIIKGKAHRRIAGHVLLVCRDGKRTHIEDSASALTDEKGKVIGVVLVFRDVTERNQLAIRLMTDEKMEAVEALANGIAVDFGNILGNISSYAESLSDSLLPGTSAHEDSVKITGEAKRAGELTHRLANIAQAIRPIQSGEVSPVRLSEALGDTVKLMEKTFTDKRISLATPDPAGFPVVMAHAGQMIDVLMNVFLNAVDAMPDGGTVSVNVAVRHIAKPNHRLNPESKGGKYAVIRISDTGCGMPRTVLERAFDPFFTTKNTGALKGLGLTMSNASVQQWGGWITIRSAAQQGTTLSIYVPAADMKSPARAAGGERLILVIDDDDACLSAICSHLKADGYKTITAKSPREGLKHFGKARIKPAMVILDLIMPGREGGREAFRMFSRFGPSVGIVIVSGFSRDFVRGYLGQGGWAFVQKPVEREHLSGVLSRAFMQRATSSTEIRHDSA